jgi:hypothetical protein
MTQASAIALGRPGEPEQQAKISDFLNLQKTSYNAVFESWGLPELIESNVS